MASWAVRSLFIATATVMALVMGGSTPPATAAPPVVSGALTSQWLDPQRLNWVANTALLDDSFGVTTPIPLDGHLRKVRLFCGATGDEACTRLDLKLGSRTISKTPIDESALISGSHRVLRVGKNTGLVLISVEQYALAADDSWLPQSTYSAKLYRYSAGKLRLLRDVWADHRRISAGRDLARPNDDGRLATGSFLDATSAGQGSFTLTWRLTGAACTNSTPSLSYRYAKAKVTLVSYLGVGSCA